MKLLKDPTAYKEKDVNNKARLPSFTFCPAEPDDANNNKSIENFEDIQKAIEKVRLNYKIRYTEHKPYEEFKPVEEKYNDTSNGVWYFAPKISTDSPFEAVICLIWTPSRKLKLKPDWSISVSYFVPLASKLYPYTYMFILSLQHFWIYHRLNGIFCNFMKRLILLICMCLHTTKDFGLKTTLCSIYNLGSKLIQSILISQITNVMKTTQIVSCIARKVTIPEKWGVSCHGYQRAS